MRSFETREVCEEIIRKFHGQPIGDEGLLLQVRYADTPAQKDLKRITTERRQFRTNEYNVGAYGAPAELLGMSPIIPSPLVPRTSQIARHMPVSRVSGSWKRDTSRQVYSQSTTPSKRPLTNLPALVARFPTSRMLSTRIWWIALSSFP